ncbi:MAG: phosphopantothenoylcysteine decarboxylase, partial [Thermoanaerobaculia bacterium]|nr:phosphopantothenoylcysteine decarboxylase [Thermoanaerobaculia bacterium]
MSHVADWDFSPPPPSSLGDHDVRPEGRHLVGKRIALMICGGIAAFRMPTLARTLRKHGAEVTAFVTEEALRYVTEDALEWSTTHKVIRRLSPDAEHLSDAAPFDAYLLPQATYNTINKIAHGIADGTVTSTLASALGRMERGQCAVLVVPTMHGTMHTSILTESLQRLDRMGVRVVPPREDYGKHNIPDDDVLVVEVCRAISRSPLKGRRFLITGGPTPVPIDNVRRIVNRFRGKLGIRIAEELQRRGADVLLVHGDGALQPPAYLPHVVARTYDEYRSSVHDSLADGDWMAAVFSAAVADYQPKTVLPGKTPSGRQMSIDLVPTAKVIDEVRSNHPDLHMVTFKYQENVSHEELMEIARKRLEVYQTVIANRGEETEQGGPQVAWLVTRDSPPQRMRGKRNIARVLTDYL